MRACDNGCKECVALLIEAHADADVVNTVGFTALMRASLTGSDECMFLLLKANATVDKKMPSGKTIISLVFENKKRNVFLC